MKYRVTWPLVATFLTLFGGAVSGVSSAEEIRCSQIENARERLQCFDRQFPRDVGAPTVQKDPYNERDRSQARQATLDVPQEDISDVGPPAPDAVASRDAAPSADDGFGFPTDDGFFSKRDRREVASRIKEVRSRDGQKMMFLLDNDQLWMQTSPRTLPIREGDQVTIKSGRIGGFLLATENGTTTRVERVR